MARFCPHMQLNPYFKASLGSQLNGVFLLIVLAAGIFLFADFGISWDENTQRNSGIVFLNHIQEKLHIHPVGIPGPVPELKDYRDREFGASFETFLFAAERLFGFSDYKKVYLFRHLLNFIFFWFGLAVFGSAVKTLFRNSYLPLIAGMILLLHPRIFADAFYNSKDIILMVFFIFSFRLFISMCETWKTGTAIWFALVSAITFNIRPAGILIPVLTLVIMTKPAIAGLRHTGDRKRFVSLFFYLVFFIFFVWLTNPYLWDDPLAKGWHIVLKFLKYDTSHTAGNLLFLGNYIPTSSLPWYYLPLWIAITTPLLYLFLLASGIIVMTRKIFNRNISARDHPGKRAALFTLAWILVPLLTAILFRSTLYDGWRHFYFIWPALVIAGIYGMNEMIESKFRIMKAEAGKPLRWILIALLVATWGYTGWFIIRWHPHQYCYFNIAAPSPEQNFELDYWGLSYREGLEDLIRKNPEGDISLRVLNLPGYLNAFMLEPAERKRLWYHHSLQEDYSTRIDSYYPFPDRPHILEAGREVNFYLSNFRDTSSPLELERYRKKECPFTGQIFSCQVDRLEIMGVYALQP